MGDYRCGGCDHLVEDCVSGWGAPDGCSGLFAGRDLVVARGHRIADLECENAKLRRKLDAVGDVLSANGCDCDCGHHYEEHDDDCERCVGCRVEAALDGTGE